MTNRNRWYNKGDKISTWIKVVSAIVTVTVAVTGVMYATQDNAAAIEVNTLEIESLENRVDEHERLPNHPVGAEKDHQIERRLDELRQGQQTILEELRRRPNG